MLWLVRRRKRIVTKHLVKSPDLESHLETLTEPKTPFSSRSKELIDSRTRLLQLRKNKRVHLEQTREESRAGIVTVITGVMSAKNSNLLMTEKPTEGKLFQMFKGGVLYTRLQISKAMCLLWGNSVSTIGACVHPNSRKQL